MDKHDISPSIDEHVCRRRVDLESIRHPAIFVIGGRKNKYVGTSFYKPFHIRSRVGKADRNHTELRWSRLPIEPLKHRQLSLADVTPGRPKHQQGWFALQRLVAVGLSAKSHQFETGN